jgi:hypothetical protein
VIEIDMHAKGLNQTMIDMALKTGMPVKAGAKYWAEHLGLGYQQADIRAAEYPREELRGRLPSRMARAILRVMAMAISISRTAALSCCIGCGRVRSGICCGAIRRWPRDMGARRIFVELRGWS